VAALIIDSDLYFHASLLISKGPSFSGEAMSAQRITTVDNSERPRLETLTNDTDANLDVTKLDLARLPAHVKATLFTDATSFNAPQLRTSGAIDAPISPMHHPRPPKFRGPHVS
jgi:hypothetical protein